MSLPQAQLVLPSMTHLAGGFVVQLCIGLIIAGISYSQAYSYSLMAARDPWLIKTTVALVVILETANSVFGIHVIYFTLIKNFGNFLALDFIVWSVKGAAVAVIFTIALARTFNVYRIYRLTQGNLTVTAVTAFVSATNIGMGFVGATSDVLKCTTWTQFLSNKTANVTFIFSMALGAFDDILVATTLIYCLIRMRTGFNRTNRLITVMIAYVINTGALTVLLDLLVVILYCTMKDSFMYQGAYCLAGRMYGVAIIGTLNQRCYFKDTEPAIITDSDMPLSRIAQSGQGELKHQVEIHPSDEHDAINIKFGDDVTGSTGSQKNSV